MNDFYTGTPPVTDRPMLIGNITVDKFLKDFIGRKHSIAPKPTNVLTNVEFDKRTGQVISSVSTRHLVPCTGAYAWITVVAFFVIYNFMLVYFCMVRNRPSKPEILLPHCRVMKRLKKSLKRFVVDELCIEAKATENILGEGQYGTVFEAILRQRVGAVFDKPVVVAVKLGRPGPLAAIGLLDEAQKLSKMNHPGIVKLIGVSVTAFRPLVAMEYLAGGALCERLRKYHVSYMGLVVEDGDDDEEQTASSQLRETRKLRTSHALAILVQVADALEYVHSNNWCHRDVAARNVLLNETDLFSPTLVVKLADFGLSAQHLPGYIQKTMGRVPLMWMPPETVTEGTFSPESDTWSFGVLCWEVQSVGLPPHYNKTAQQIVSDIKMRQGIGLPLPASVNRDFHKFMLKCWRVWSSDRPRFFHQIQTEKTKTISRMLRDLQQQLRKHPEKDSVLEMMDQNSTFVTYPPSYSQVVN